MIAGVLAVLVAGIHLLHPRLGFPRLIDHLRIGTLFDPRPLTFTLAGLAILVGIVLVYHRYRVGEIYLLGMALMVTFLLGYAVWHTVLDHGGFWPHIHGHGHADTGVVETVWVHLAGDTVAAMSKLYEVLLLVLLFVLYRVDPLVAKPDQDS